MPKYAEFTVGLVIFLFLFFAIFLFTYQKGRRLSKNLLGFFFLALGLAVADVAMQVNNTYQQVPQVAFIFNTLPLLYGPLLWLLTKSATASDYTLKKVDYLHFLPYGLALFTFVLVYHLRPLEYKRTFLERASSGQEMSQIVSSFLVFAMIGLYVFWSYRRIQKYRHQLKEQVSNIEKMNLSWLQHTLFGFTAIIFFSAILQILSYALGTDTHWLNGILLLLLFGLLFFIMSSIAKGLKSDVIFPNFLGQTNSKPSLQKVIKPIDSIELRRLRTYMTTERPYLNPAINLKELADQVNLTPRDLSTLINKGTQQSFFDFINSYRIQFAQDKIRQSTDEKLTILEVMYAAGFNSKSSFNTAFKKHTNLTPTQWKKVHKRN
ncbi:MAG: helix-turn-helix domain-containing protein [Bacteroidota bacterium]